MRLADEEKPINEEQQACEAKLLSLMMQLQSLTKI